MDPTTVTTTTGTTTTVATSTGTTLTLSDVPPELKDLYNSLYTKISDMIVGKVVDFKTDPTLLRILLQSAMTVVADQKTWTTWEKEQNAISLLKYIINDLAVKGKIDPTTAQEIILNADFWGSIVINLLQDIVAEGQQFEQDASSLGCKAACAKDCCAIL
jgi:hypothetical protein